MEEEITKQDIIKALKKHRRGLTTVINSLQQLDETDDKRMNRILANRVVIYLFEFIDSFIPTEIDIHNFMKRRG